MRIILKSLLRKTDIVCPLNIKGEPQSMPIIPNGFEVVGRFDGAWLATCNTLEDMQMLYWQCQDELIKDLSWYSIKYVIYFFDDRQL